MNDDRGQQGKAGASGGRPGMAEDSRKAAGDGGNGRRRQGRPGDGGGRCF